MPNRLSIPDAINQVGGTLQTQYGKRIPKAAIVDAVVKLSRWKASSVMPSDFCYNRSNLGARPVEYCVFLEHGSGFYEYVGRNYATARSA